MGNVCAPQPRLGRSHLAGIYFPALPVCGAGAASAPCPGGGTGPGRLGGRGEDPQRGHRRDPRRRLQENHINTETKA